MPADASPAIPSDELHSSALLRPAQRRAVLLGMMAGVSLAAIDQMVLSTAVSAIAAEFGDISQAPWVFTANLLTSAASMPIWGKLGDLFGRRRVFQSAISLFIIASLLAAMSDSMAWLLVCRALQGLGGGALLTIPYAILGDIIPPRERTAYVAFITVVWTTAGFIGPPLGGFLVEGPGWRWMFYLNVPAALVSFALIQWGYRLPRQRIEHRIDFLGAGLLFSAVGALILYTSWAGEAIGWRAPLSLALIATSAVLGAGFVLQERRAEEPIVQLAIFKMQAVWAPLLATSLFGFVNFSIAFFLPLYSLVVRGTDAVQAGFTLAPLTGGMLVAGLIIGRRATATRSYRRYATLALAIYTAGLALLSTVTRTTPTLQFLSYSLLLGFGSGTLGPVVISSLQNAVDEKYLGVVSSLPGFSRAIAQTIGTSILGTLLTARIAAHLQAEVASLAGPGANLAEFIARPAAVRTLADPLQTAVIEAYRSAFNETFLTMVAVACLSLIATRFMVDPADG